MIIMRYACIYPSDPDSGAEDGISRRLMEVYLPIAKTFYFLATFNITVKLNKIIYNFLRKHMLLRYSLKLSTKKNHKFKASHY